MAQTIEHRAHRTALLVRCTGHVQGSLQAIILLEAGNVENEWQRTSGCNRIGSVSLRQQFCRSDYCFKISFLLS